MELVEGRSVTAWLREGERTPPQIIDVFLEAGRALAATHAAGALHRNFTAESVLVDAAGRVHVGGSGLPGAPSSQAQAPEQYRGDEPTARTDQFGFCVALFHALYGEPPFAGDTPEALRAALEAGVVRVPSTVQRAPKRIHDALLRGLRVAPSERWPSMTALLGQLAPTPARAPILAGLALAGVGAAIAIGATLLVARRHAARAVDPCAGTAARFAEVWSPARKSAIHAGLVAAAPALAEDTFAQLTAWGDAYAGQWIASATRVCHARRDGARERRLACLDGLRRDVREVGDELVHPTADQASHALLAIRAVAPVSRCDD